MFEKRTSTRIMEETFEFSEFVKDFSKQCSKVQTKKFKRNEVITTYIQKRKQVCILIKGTADLIRYNFNGNRTIVEHFSQNDIFGETFYTITTNNELFVISKTECEVLFFNYNDIHQKCKNNCKFHERLNQFLPELILDKMIELNGRLELLTKRGIREKILAYFGMLSQQKLNRTFIIPFSYTDLADYLSVDRSAMMREIKNLIEDGFIKKNKNKITLLY